MNTEKQFVSLSRALFELRSGRAITVDDFSFKSIEGDSQPVGGTLIAPSGIDDKLLPSSYVVPKTELQELAIELLKKSGLLPVIVVVDSSDMHFSIKEIKAGLKLESQNLQEVARANLPIKYTEDAKIVSFRSNGSGAEHLAVVIGNPSEQDAPLVRVHSSCITGDLLGSLRCDCGDQLHLALDQIAKAGNGVVCYLQQEGRGIGISNKIRAYSLQEQGQDTYDANISLGFAADERDFGIASEMLKALGIKQITLLSNNPDKVAQLEGYGVSIASRERLVADHTDHNSDYMKTKADRFGHKI